jgi:CO dehydrogenase maturation factor
MGRSEGPGCYCAVNHNLREVVDSISKNYRFIVIDNEAGMEHLSRRTTRDVEHLLVVTDPTQRGLVAAQRIADLSRELDIRVENAYLIVNRVSGELPPAMEEAIEKLNIQFLGVVPEDKELTEFEFSGRPLVELGDESPVYSTVAAMMAKLFD